MYVFTEPAKSLHAAFSGMLAKDGELSEAAETFIAEFVEAKQQIENKLKKKKKK